MKHLWKAILGVQGRVMRVKRDATNPHFRNRYTTLEAVYMTLRPAMQEEGLAAVQMPTEVTEGRLHIRTVLVHAESGETLENVMQMPVPKMDPQGVGSAITYGCRYSLMAMLGLAPSDDDGDAARIDNPRQVDRTAPDGTPVPTLEDAKHNHANTIDAICQALDNGDEHYAAQCWHELTMGEQMALWVAPSKGGPFTTEQRRILKAYKREDAA